MKLVIQPKYSTFRGFENAQQHRPDLTFLFVNQAAAKRMTKIYEKFSGRTQPFADLVYEKKNYNNELQFLGAVEDGATTSAVIVSVC